MLLALLVLGLLSTLASLPGSAYAQTTVGITCFGFDGQPYVNNTVCPGSNTCCGVEATCLSNRLCHNKGDAPNLFVRGPCTQQNWDSTCPQICLYNETDGGNFLPRVTPCNDGSLCCNNDPQCCEAGRGIFLDGNGNLVSSSVTAAITFFPPASGTNTQRFTSMPISSITLSSAAATTTASASHTAGLAFAPSLAPVVTSAVLPSASSTFSSDASSDGTVSLKVGLGLGIPLAVLVSGCAVFFLSRMNRRRVGTTPGLTSMELLPNDSSGLPRYSSWRSVPIAETNSVKSSRIYEIDRRKAPSVIYELDGGQATSKN